jgi:hypothetical protein
MPGQIGSIALAVDRAALGIADSGSTPVRVGFQAPVR